jgi:hypothetical protein
VHAYVTALRHSIPPHSEPIDITQPFWLRQCLQQLLRGMVDIKVDSATLVEETAGLYRRIIDSLVFVVVNYRSVSRPGQIGGRHTATYLNPRNYVLHDVTPQEVGDVREENYVVLPRATRWDERRRLRQIEDVWFNLWKSYHHQPEPPVEFTLNSALLFQTLSPRPVFVSWLDRAPAVALHRALTPISLNAPRAQIRAWSMRDAQAPQHPDLPRFAEAFRAMYFHNRPTDAAIAAAMGRVTEFFGGLGGDCFFSIPASIRIRSGGGGIENDTDLRAVVSVSLKHEWDAAFYGAAWQFFSGIASQILCDIMCSEHIAQAHQKWDRTRADAVYLASHPLKHRLNRINLFADEVNRELRTIIQSEAKQELLSALLRKTTQLKRSAVTAAGFVNLMNLLYDLFDDSAREAIGYSSEINRKSPKESNGWIDMNELLLSAARQAQDVRTGRRTVELRGDTRSKCPIPRRLNHGDLARHEDMEVAVLRLIFDELLQNAANYGFIPAGGDTGSVPVLLTKVFSFNTCYIVLENLIAPEFTDRARDIVTRLKDSKHHNVASGLRVAQQIPVQLVAGDVQFAIGIPEPEHWPELNQSDLHTWRSTIVLEV